MAKNCGKHYKCVEKNDFKALDAKTLGLVSGILLAGSFVLPIPGLGVASGILLMAAVWDLCRFLEGGKMICLENEVCVIGKVMELIPVWSDKAWWEMMDDDFTFNILLSPHAGDPETEDRGDQNTITTSREFIENNDPVQGKFITEQAGLIPAGLDYQQEKHYDNLFHCEIKGCAVHDACIALKILSVPGAILASTCALLGPLLCLLALLIWAIVTAATTAIVIAASHHGEQNDVLDPSSGEVGEGDLVLIKGDWVYDAGHEGWNEIQPVRYMQKLTMHVDSIFHGLNKDASGDFIKADLALVQRFKEEVLDIWCGLAKEADKDTVIDAQKEPENDWSIHPCIDGCKEPVVIL